MAIANPEKTARMKQAVDAVMGGRMNNKQASIAFDLAYSSIANAISRERHARRVPGLHPVLKLFNSCQFVKSVAGVVK